MGMFRKTVLLTTLFVVCAVSFVIRVHFEMLGGGGLGGQGNGIGLPYQPPFLVSGLGFSSVILLAASLGLFGKEWFAYCIHRRKPLMPNPTSQGIPVRQGSSTSTEVVRRDQG